MSKFLNLAAAAALSVIPMSAEAFPVSGGPDGHAGAPITLVAGGCGVGFHRGPLGGCRPNGAIAVIRRPVCRLVLLPLPHRVCR